MAKPGISYGEVTYYRDDVKMPANPESPQTAHWDTRTEQPGVYTFWAEVIGKDGYIYHTPQTIIAIPVRVAVSGLGRPVDVTNSAKSLTLSAAIAKDLVLTAVEYEMDGIRVATRNAAPFDKATIDATYLEPGDHKLIIRAFDAGGAVYSSEPQDFTATNAPLIAERARAEKGVAEAVAADAAEKREYARHYFRKQIAGSALIKGR